ncbi:hypothetical protein GEMRC1_003431 [Eukaryota sp. GEM-RC1]
MNDAFFNILFELKFTTKRLEKLSAKRQRESDKKQRIMLKYLHAGDSDIARIHASDVLRKKNESLNALRMASHVDAIRGKLESYSASRSAIKTLDKATKALTSSGLANPSSMFQSIEQLNGTLEKLGIQTEFVNSALSSTSNVSTTDVESYIASVAESTEFDSVLSSFPDVPVADDEEEDSEEEEVQERNPVAL